VTVWLIITRTDVRVVKRRPESRPGQWIVRLAMTFPPERQPMAAEIDLPTEPDLVSFGAEVESDGESE
jgi:hypothetical protein